MVNVFKELKTEKECIKISMSKTQNVLNKYTPTIKTSNLVPFAGVLHA